MEKQKRWQLLLILTVIAITIFNVLPTMFYYSQPLDQPISADKAKKISQNISKNIETIKSDNIKWLNAYCKNLQIKPSSIANDNDDSSTIVVKFQNKEDLTLFSKYFDEAGAAIPFVPAQMSLAEAPSGTGELTLRVKRNLKSFIPPSDYDRYFTYSTKFSAKGSVDPFYKELVNDRLFLLLKELIGQSSQNETVNYLLSSSSNDQRSSELAVNFAEKIVAYQNVFGSDSDVPARFHQQLTKSANGKSLKTQLSKRFEESKSYIENLEKELLAGQTPENMPPEKRRFFETLTKQKQSLQSALTILTTSQDKFASPSFPYSDKQIKTLIEQSAKSQQKDQMVQDISLDKRHPFISNVILDWKAGKVFLKLHDDVAALRSAKSNTEKQDYQKEQTNYLLFNEIARISRESDEVLSPKGNTFELSLDNLQGSRSVLALNLQKVAEQRTNSLLNKLRKRWTPEHSELKASSFPIYSWEEFSTLSEEQKQLGLVVLAPVANSSAPEEFNNNSLYIVAKGLNKISNKISQNAAQSEETEKYLRDWALLNELLKEEGFHIRYSGAEFSLPGFDNDIIFRQDEYYQNLVAATREDFKVSGSKKFATLEFSNMEQRILTENKIDDKIHEELLTWKQDYQKAQVDLNAESKYKIPAPTKNALMANVALTMKKYVKGDDRKILKWGLDLKGGKSVRIGLKDQNNQAVSNVADLNQARNELYNRVNKMGVTEVNLRIEGNNIIADFPASQNFSAKELIKASAMYFHITNEKFGPHNPAIAKDVHQFLQGVWNEAVVTNQTEIANIQEIAYKHLTGGSADEDAPAQPTNSYAKTLYENGLRLANPKKDGISHTYNDTLSTIAKYRGDSPSSWGGHSHPLSIVFNNYALEGSSLDSVQPHYDPTDGHNLSFTVSGSYTKGNLSGNPRDDFYQWTSQYSKEGIKGTPKESFSKGEGWRMAVILNGQIISSPTLNASLRNQAKIVGRFSQREVAQLAADLKAGSLSFTPQILSEENVSPELGQGERSKGINATILGLVAVVAAMILVYRYAGFISSIAILFNLLIMWGILQNLNAILTLSGIAGIILTIGMAVDANVLVFERIKEEFAISGKISSAIQAGYKKAFSAIFDSNITTIIAAFILLQFDSGPIKGFAVTIMIGIISSMFTALFMTRFYFIGWIQNPKNTKLNMSNLIHNTKVDFLAKFKYAIVICLAVTLVGGFLMYEQRNTILGMDFTGGYAINLDLKEQGQVSYRDKLNSLLTDKGINPGDVQIRELDNPNELYVQLGRGIDQEGKPFYGMPEELELEKFTYNYEKNPRLAWLVQLLNENNLPLKERTLPSLGQNWKLMSGQLSDAMKNQAILSLGLALFCILVYISFRFEFKYGISAILALVNDILVSLGILAICNRMGMPIQIDMQVIGAIMTIIGYSLNDTIIVFDRIREDVQLYRKKSLRDIINQAINATLNRTLMTSGTTLLVLVALLLFSGQAIFSFALIMTVGVVVGTISSLFLASPIMLFFHYREQHALKQQNA
ncbi:MAG: protein translocase subunit SecD [Chlamydiales bacterium]|nr:protein translocase subunit SecD [Chlamydiales bacterium]NCF70284.1 protein translocase subunit SecD [Chlamydiales bacterium]